MVKKIIVLALILALMASAMMPSQTLGQPPHKEQHPAIRNAIQALEEARYDLEHAAHDFGGGHRVKALKAVDQVIKQLRKALEYDRK
jgi:hypothetical protein